MNVLYIAQKPIFPNKDGGTFAMQQFFESLINCDINLSAVFLSTQKHPFNLAEVPAEIQKSAKIHSFELNTEVKPLPALKHLILKKSYNLHRFYNASISASIQEIIKTEKIDTVIFESVFSAIYLPDLKQNNQLQFIIRTHNIENQIWKDLALKSNSFLKKRYLQSLSRSLELEETTLLRQADKIFSISKTDSRELTKITLQSKIIEIPLAIEMKQSVIVPTAKKIAHLGSMNWQPNIDSVNYIINKILPLLPDFQFKLAGSFMPEQPMNVKNKQIENLGKVQDLNEFYQNCGIFVVPLFSGSGVKVKILEALSYGVPIVTTRKGIQGLDLENGREILIAETPQEFANCISKLDENSELKIKLGQNAKNYVLKNHDSIKIKQLICANLND